ncbi:hypothetical protein Droror1_Dr00009179 [Drosera rotundifolia]
MEKLSLQNTHVKLLPFDLLSLTQTRIPASSDPITFTRNGVPITRVETLGLVVSRDLKPDKFLKFFLDDGTGMTPCILWLNHTTSQYFSRRCLSDVRLIARMATMLSNRVQLGVTVRVRGKVASFRGAIQVTVEDVVVERDPYAEILHWVDCVRLATKCYDAARGRNV